MMRAIQLAVACAAVLVTTVGQVQAAVLTMDQGRHYSLNYDNGGMGTGRGVGFQANQDFQISSLGIDLRVPDSATAPLYTFELFSSSDGSTTGSLLSAVTFNLVVGSGYQDQGFNYAITKDSFYVINFSRVDDQHLGQLGTKYSWEDRGVFVPHDYGILTVLEGFEGANPNSSNPLIPHMRIGYAGVSAVPEPSSLAIFAIGACVAGFGGRRRRR